MISISQLENLENYPQVTSYRDCRDTDNVLFPCVLVWEGRVPLWSSDWRDYYLSNLQLRLNRWIYGFTSLSIVPEAQEGWHLPYYHRRWSPVFSAWRVDISTWISATNQKIAQASLIPRRVSQKYTISANQAIKYDSLIQYPGYRWKW